MRFLFQPEIPALLVLQDQPVLLAQQVQMVPLALPERTVVMVLPQGLELRPPQLDLSELRRVDRTQQKYSHSQFLKAQLDQLVLMAQQAPQDLLDLRVRMVQTAQQQGSALQPLRQDLLV